MTRNENGRSEVSMELKRRHIENDPIPEKCSVCGGELTSGSGMVGEEVLYCTKGHGIMWEDCEQAIAIVY